MNMGLNKNPLLLTEGHVFVDGVEIMDCVKCEIKFTPDVWKGKVIGERSPSSRWKGYEITGTITQRRTTPFFKKIVEKYQKDGITPVCSIQGQMTDEGSDYYRNYGACSATAIDCVFTGDIMLIALDSGGDVVDDSISFNAKDVSFP